MYRPAMAQQPYSSKRPSKGPRSKGPESRGKPPFDKSSSRKGRDEPPAPPPIPGLATRQAALDLLGLIRKGFTLEDALDRGRSFNELMGADRGFARALVSAVLRRQGAIDEIIGQFVDRPLGKKGSKAQEILRLMAAQLLILKTPDHAAVSTAVALAQSYREVAGYASLVNAVGRKLTKIEAGKIEALPARIDTPGWMWRSWEKAYGPVVARRIAAAHYDEPPLDLTPRENDGAAALATELKGDVILGASVRLTDAPPVEEIAGFKEGRWWVQNAAAALPVRLFGDFNGMKVYDLCAAPGGKTMQLAALGGDVTAVDINGPRLKRVQDNLGRVGLKAQTVKEDLKEWKPVGKADCVLLDAPCTATGTIRRHPDILRFKTQDDLEALVAVQAALIDQALAAIRPGGVFVYVTCSLQAEECGVQIDNAIRRHGGLERKPILADEIGGLEEAITKDGDMRVFPFMLGDKGGLDGIFASRLVKRN